MKQEVAGESSDVFFQSNKIRRKVVLHVSARSPENDPDCAEGIIGYARLLGLKIFVKGNKVIA
jgi:hypothetical protein